MGAETLADDLSVGCLVSMDTFRMSEAYHCYGEQRILGMISEAYIPDSRGFRCWHEHQKDTGEYTQSFERQL